MLVAHETGHVLGLCHYADILTYRSPPANLADLALNEYTLGVKTGVPVPLVGTVTLTYARYNTYLSASGIVSQDLFETHIGDLAGNTFLSSDSDLPPIASPWAWWIYSALDWAAYGPPLSGWVAPNVVVESASLNPIVSTPVGDLSFMCGFNCRNEGQRLYECE